MRRKASRASRRLTIAAVALAVTGGLAFDQYAAALERDAHPGGPAVAVVVAARDLPRGATLSAGDVRLARIPREFAPPGSFGATADVTGRTLLAPIDLGEPVTRSRLGAGAGPVAALVPYGLRAISITTSLPESAVSPGDHVDVIATFATGRPHTETVVEGAEILVVLEPNPSSEVGGTTLMLLVTAEDAGRLAYARAFADLSVAIAPGA